MTAELADGSSSLELSAVVPITTAEGPGPRFAVWVQGCSLGCPGCCNPGMHGPGGGHHVRVDALLAQLDRAVASHGIEGITVLGGEPLQQLPAVASLCAGATRRGLGVIVFTGYRLEEARERPGFASLWSHVDTLVDGRYDARRPEPAPRGGTAGGRRFIGSTNQRLCHRTDRYRDPARWQGPRGVEVHVGPDGRLHAHGEPGAVRDLLRALR